MKVYMHKEMGNLYLLEPDLDEDQYVLMTTYEFPKLESSATFRFFFNSLHDLLVKFEYLGDL